MKTRSFGAWPSRRAGRGAQSRRRRRPRQQDPVAGYFCSAPPLGDLHLARRVGPVRKQAAEDILDGVTRRASTSSARVLAVAVPLLLVGFVQGRKSAPDGTREPGVDVDSIGPSVGAHADGDAVGLHVAEEEACRRPSRGRSAMGGPGEQTSRP